MNIALGAAMAYAVLIPGSGSSGDRIWLNNLNWATAILGGDHYFAKLQDDLGKAGLPAIVCPRTPDQDSRTIEERAEECVANILAREPSGCGAGATRHVHLLGHSMGGLVGRTLAQDPRVEGCIGSLTMVSTPNQGTPLGDWAIDHAAADDQSFDILGRIVKLVDFVPSSLHYLPQLRTDRKGYPASVFAAQDMPDNPEVDYFSATTSMKWIPIPPLETTRLIISAEMKTRGLDQTSYGAANDGIVPEYSMAHGTPLGHLNANHWASACVDPVKTTPECTASSKVLVKHLLEQAHR
jgi:pimeloyl-ACP methyl ester carboxylesterase